MGYKISTKHACTWNFTKRSLFFDGEPHEKLGRQAKNRKELQKLLDTELGQLSRTSSYTNWVKSIQDVTSLIVQSNEEERNRFIQYRERLLNVAEIVSLNFN